MELFVSTTNQSPIELGFPALRSNNCTGITRATESLEKLRESLLPTLRQSKLHIHKEISLKLINYANDLGSKRIPLCTLFTIIIGVRNAT